MRNKYFVIGAILLIGAGTLLFAGCKKESPTTKSTDETINAADMKLSNMIENFKAKGKSHLKSGEEMSIDSAKWYLRATANYTYGDASKVTDEVKTDTLLITIPLNEDGKIPFGTVWSKYEEMIEGIRAFYHGLNYDDKQLMAVENQIKAITSDHVIFKVVSTFSTGHITPSIAFNNIDSWRPFGASDGIGGICDGPNQGMYPNKDLATEIQRRIMMYRAVPIGNYFYDPVDSKYLYGFEYLVSGFTGNPNYMGYYIYFSQYSYPGYDHCLPPNECNFYLNGTQHVINTPQNEGGAKPDGMSFISLTGFKGVLYLDIPGSTMHEGYANYGVLHSSPNPPNPLD
jgi:hypothetical protein